MRNNISKVEIDSIWNQIIEIVDNTSIYDFNRMSNLKNLLLNYKEGFCNAPAARKLHHNYRGGLLKHTFDVINISFKIFDIYSLTNYFPEESVFISAILHDLHKIKTYNISNTDKITINKDFNVEHDIWTINEANKYGLNLSYDEMMGILQAHGGWSKINSPTHPLACIIHCADMISSQLLIL